MACARAQSSCGRVLRVAGSVAMVSLRSRQLLFNLKMNGTARSAAFSPDGRDLLTMGASVFMLVAVSNTQMCMHRAA